MGLGIWENQSLQSSLLLLLRPQTGCPRRMPEPTGWHVAARLADWGPVWPQPELSSQVLVALCSWRFLRRGWNGLRCVPQIPMSKPQHPAPQSVTVFGDQDFNEVIKVHEATGVGPDPKWPEEMRMDVQKEEHRRTRREGGHLHTQEGGLGGNQSCPCPGHGRPASRTGRKSGVCGLGCPAGGSCYDNQSR